MDSYSPRLVACCGTSCQEVRFMELKETAGEAILRIEPVFLLEKGVHVRISPPQILGIHFACIGEIKRATVLHRQACQTLRKRVAFRPPFGRKRLVQIKYSNKGFLPRRVREKTFGSRPYIADGQSE